MKEKLKRFAKWLVSPAMQKRYLVALIGLITLFALFHVEENWRGARAWNQLKAELLAKGEPLTIASSIPPEVPDAENFCATPLLTNLPNAEATNIDPKTGNHLPPPPPASNASRQCVRKTKKLPNQSRLPAHGFCRRKYPSMIGNPII